jgi:hypothetical protein
VTAALTTSFYAAPQVPADAQRLFDAAAASAGYDGPIQVPLRATRAAGSSLVLAREWAIADLEARLADAIEASYEPTWDLASGEFTWGMGLDEPYPRGQFNAFLAAAEAAGPGAWTRLSDAPVDQCPQVVGVDFPSIGLSRAEWVDGALHLRVEPLVEAPSRRTSFRITGANGHAWTLTGPENATVATGPNRLTVTMPVRAADLVISPAG